MAQRTISTNALRDVSNDGLSSRNIGKAAVPISYGPSTTNINAPNSARGVFKPSSRSSSSGDSAVVSARGVSSGVNSHLNSPGADRRNRDKPTYATEYIGEIVEHFLQRERTVARDANYLANQPEVNERMRTILVDWLVDVHIKFKLHPETFFLAVDIVDRYLAVERATRASLQLVGITAMLIAAKYEELWAPEVKECVYISANTYTREEILKMEGRILSSLQYKLTLPTPYPILTRLLDVTDADSQTRHTAMFFLENAMLDYKNLNYLPSMLAYSSLLLANLSLRGKEDAWNSVLQYYSKASLAEIQPCARNLLSFTMSVTNSKYQAIRRKYTAVRYGEVSRMTFPDIDF